MAKLFLQEFPEALAWFLSQGFSDPSPYQGRGGGEQEGLREGQGPRETKAESAMEMKQRDECSHKDIEGEGGQGVLKGLMGAQQSPKASTAMCSEHLGLKLPRCPDFGD